MKELSSCFLLETSKVNCIEMHSNRCFLCLYYLKSRNHQGCMLSDVKMRFVLVQLLSGEGHPCLLLRLKWALQQLHPSLQGDIRTCHWKLSISRVSPIAVISRCHHVLFISLMDYRYVNKRSKSFQSKGGVGLILDHLEKIVLGSYAVATIPYSAEIRCILCHPAERWRVSTRFPNASN